MQPEEVRQLVVRAFPDGEITVEDMTGTMDHFQITVLSPRFQGLIKIDQHRLVQAPLQGALDDGRIHAIKIKTIAS